MTASSRPITALLALLATLLYHAICSAAEPVQYCKFGDPNRANQDVDFCLSLLTHRNASTGAHDLYATFTHTRRQLSATGWTAVGIGDSMTGALMFIIYGDPSSGAGPIVSIRASTGHDQPTLITRGALNGADLRVLRAAWLPPASPAAGTTTSSSSSSVVATVSLVCFSCTLWPGTPLSATATSQPWIWAWNADQAFGGGAYPYDAHLRMHRHHAGSGGWGVFYVDMARSESTARDLPSLPPIRPGVAALGASDAPGVVGGLAWMSGMVRHDPLLHLHGLVMAVAFLLVFPAGVLAMRSGARRAFSWHWIAQAAGSALAVGGCVAGLVLRREIDTTHQAVGLAIGVALGAQALLGWRHHVDFVRVRRRTAISFAHIWVGRAIMVGGGVNLVLGMLLRGYSSACLGLAVLFMVLEATGVGVWVWRAQRRAVRARRLRVDGDDDDDDDDEREKERQLGTDKYFSIASDEDEKDAAGEDDSEETQEGHVVGRK